MCPPTSCPPSGSCVLFLPLCVTGYLQTWVWTDPVVQWQGLTCICELQSWPLLAHIAHFISQFQQHLRSGPSRSPWMKLWILFCSVSFKALCEAGLERWVRRWGGLHGAGELQLGKIARTFPPGGKSRHLTSVEHLLGTNVLKCKLSFAPWSVRLQVLVYILATVLEVPNVRTLVKTGLGHR